MASAEFVRRSADAVVLHPAVDDRAGIAIRVLVPEYPRLGRSQLPVILGTADGLEFWDDRSEPEPAAVLPWSRVVAMNGPGPASRLGGLRIRVRRGDHARTVEIPLRPGGAGPQILPEATIEVLANRLRLLAEAVGTADDVPEARPSSVGLLPGRDSLGYLSLAGWISLAGATCMVVFFLGIWLVPLDARREPLVAVPLYAMLAAFIVSIFVSLGILQYGDDRVLRETSAGYRIAGVPWPVGIPLVDRQTGEVVPVPEGTAPPGTI